MYEHSIDELETFTKLYHGHLARNYFLRKCGSIYRIEGCNTGKSVIEFLVLKKFLLILEIVENEWRL